MRGVDAAELSGLGGQRDQFLGGRVGRGRVLQRGRDADRAVAHGIAHQGLHALQFRRVRRAVVVAQHHAAHLGRAHIAGQVDSHALLLQAREVLVESPPVGIYAVVLIPDAIGFQDGIVDRRDGGPFAGDFGGDPLVDLRRQVRIYQDGQLGLAEHVDESRGHHHAARIDGAPGGRARQIADGGDPALPDADVSGVPRRTGSVDDPAVLDHHIVRAGGQQEERK